VVLLDGCTFSSTVSAITATAAVCCIFYVVSAKYPGQVIHEGLLPETELVQQNWVDCIGKPKKEKQDCLARWRLSDSGEAPAQASSGASDAGSNELKAKKAQAAQDSKSASHVTGDDETSAKAKAAQEAAEVAQKAAAQSKERQEKAAKELLDAKELVEKQKSKADADGDDIDSWYKEKVKKVNQELKSTKTTIKSTKVSAIEGAKDEARSQGAHVSDIPTGA